MAKSCQLHAGIFLLALVCLQSGAGARVVGTRLLNQAVHAVGQERQLDEELIAPVQPQRVPMQRAISIPC